MQMNVGYKLIDVSTGQAVQTFGGTWGTMIDPPNPLILPNGDHVCAAQPGEVYSGFMLQPWVMEKPVQTVFDGLTFLARLTDQEYGAILTAAQTNVQLARWLDMVRLANSIDVSSTVAQEAKAGVITLGLLTQERAAAVFATA